jgi:ABC-2 type transport system permease protein
VALGSACFGIYLLGIAVFAHAGVVWALLTPRPLGIVLVLGPLATLAALQLAVCVSSRVNDPRSAQQIGALVILPIAGLLVAQITGSFQLTVLRIMLVALVLTMVNVVLLRIGVALFDRESILTRWK